MRRQASSLASAALAALLIAITGGAAEAATTGNIQARVTDQATGKALAGVTVSATGPQGEQTEFTDAGGSCVITDLEPGEYMVRFYFSNVKVERPNVLVQADRTATVTAAIPTRSAKELRYVIKERAPTVDVATTQGQTQLTSELVENTPTGRNYSAVLALAPGSATDPVGLSFNGATGPENQFLIDGLNTTSPSTGLIGSSVPLKFIGETEIITSGYAAEYGRATGGIVNVITKSGTNEFHGGAWYYYTPLLVTPDRIARPGEAVARIQRSTDHSMDFGVDIGGPIVKNRLFFYAGFSPTFSTATYERILRRRTHDDFDPKSTQTFLGDLDTSITCPPWLKDRNEALCAPATAAAYKTEDLDPRFWRHYESVTRSYNAIAKLNLRINDNHAIALTYIANPQTFVGVSGSRFNGNPLTDTYPYSNPTQTHDLVGTYSGKFLDHRLQVDLRAGWHYENSETIPTALGASQGSNSDTRTLSLQVFEDELEPCKNVKLGPKEMQKDFNPCPVTSYRDGGFGFRSRLTNQRAVASVGATWFVKLLGTHAIKLGGDFEYNYFQNFRAYTGGAFTTFGSDPNNPKAVAFVERQQYATVDPNDPNHVIVLDGQDGRPLGFTATTSTLNESIYLRDSWNFGFLPGFTLNAGLRWEAQQVRDVNGVTQIGIYDNWAPRIGFAYDFLGKGRSKLYGSYGRFYESIPLDINDRQFSGEGLAIQDLQSTDTGACQTDTNGRVLLNTCKYPTPTRDNLNGGTFGIVSPKLQGQYSNEVTAGVQWSPGLDFLLGVAYVHRDLGRVVEDVSADGGRTYVIANPGVPADSGTVEKLQGQIDALGKQIAGTADPAKLDALTKLRTDASTQLSLYNAAAAFEKPKRDYNALVITASKRLSYNFQVVASYTYSRTIGNYPGLFQASNGQLDPNISTQYDLPELLVNRNGPLPNDRPHNLKLIGSYAVPLGVAGGLTFGVNFYAQSGTPIEVLGRHPTYGANESFILPRGSGGRTPTLTQLDLRIAYGKSFPHGVRAEVSLDVFNVLNLQQVTSVDQSYTTDRVLPIPNGTYDDLKTLKNTSGSVPKLNPNFGQPTGFQAPISLRAGARITF